MTRKRDANSLTLFEHLEDLRWTLIKAALIVGAGAVLGWALFDDVYWILIAPLQPFGDRVELITESMLEGFMLRVEAALLFGVVATIPVLLYLTWEFVAPGLLPRERRLGGLTVSAGTVFFACGALFAFQLIPHVLDFMLQFTPPNAQPRWPVRVYLASVFRLVLAFGIVFEMPVVMVLAVRVGVVSTAALARARPYAVVGVFILAAILTPPDGLSQVMLGVPLVLLYEIGLLACRVAERVGFREYPP